MIIVHITWKTIKSVTKKGISYVDDSGVQCFIDFEVCLKNRIDYYLTHNLVNPEKIEDFKQGSRCVGDRNYHNGCPCIDLYTKPITRFVFVPSIVIFRLFYWWENRERFERFAYYDVINAGYITAELG